MWRKSKKAYQTQTLYYIKWNNSYFRKRKKEKKKLPGGYLSHWFLTFTDFTELPNTNRNKHKGFHIERVLHTGPGNKQLDGFPAKKKKKRSYFLFFFRCFPKQKRNKNTYIYINTSDHHGSSFKETTRASLFRFATFTKMTERQDGAHHGRRTFCSPFKQATLIRLSSLQSVMKSPHFMWHRLIKRRICSVVNIDRLSKYSPLTPFSLKIWR